MVLEVYEYKVIGVANNGEEAVEFYKKFPEKPDIILMDHRMPIKNGIDASKEILQINPKAKIIFTSADKDVMNEAILIGAVCFKPKPFTNQRLIDNIEKALALKESIAC